MIAVVRLMALRGGWSSSKIRRRYVGGEMKLKNKERKRIMWDQRYISTFSLAYVPDKSKEAVVFYLSGCLGQSGIPIPVMTIESPELLAVMINSENICGIKVVRMVLDDNAPHGFQINHLDEIWLPTAEEYPSTGPIILRLAGQYRLVGTALQVVEQQVEGRIRLYAK